MSKLSDDKREVLAYIDAILTMIEKYPKMGIGEGSFNVNLSATVNPFSFLMDIISKKVGESEMIDWLVGFLTSSLPAIELGVKGVLLSNLKQTIDCNNDPLIPEWMRMSPNNSVLNNTNVNDRGLIINLKNIDYSNMLSYSPLSDVGQMKYFGTKRYYKFNISGLDDVKYYSYYDGVREIEKLRKKAENNPNHGVVPTINNLVRVSEIDNVYELSRAKDFNAFLWFVVNKSNFINNTDIDRLLGDYSDKIVRGEYVFSESDTVLGKVKGTFTTENNDPSPFAPGSTIKQNIGGTYYNVVSLCTKMVTIDDYQYSGGTNTMGSIAELKSTKNKRYEMDFVPVSHDLSSANWYTNSGTFFNFLLPEKSRKPRDYNKDFPLCNLKLLVGDDLINQRVNGNDFEPITEETYVRLTILPKPLIHYPQLKFEPSNPFKNVGEPFWRYRKLLFNEKGEPDNNGHYTVMLKSDNSIDNSSGNSTVYTLVHNNTVTVNWEDGSYVLEGNNILSELIECYPGLTVYDFNYNFVMGMQLFEPSVVASQLIDLVTNITMFGVLGVNVNLNRSETLYQMRISEIVKNIVESTAYEASDCFYSFSNKKYNDMLQKSELKRSRAYPFSDSRNQASTPSLDGAYSILNEYDEEPNLIKTQNILTRAFTQATASITEEVLPEDRYNIRINLIQEMIKGLVMVIVNSLLTPKIVLLFEVNRQIMGGHDEHLSIEDFIESISGLITSIVIEIRDMILNALLEWAKDILMEFIEKMAAILSLEQAQYYARLMSALFKACSFKVSHRKALDSQLDNVDYADIDEVEQPIIKDC